MPAEQLTLLPETSDVAQHVRRPPRAREIQQRWTLVALLQKSVMGEVHLHGIKADGSVTIGRGCSTAFQIPREDLSLNVLLWET